MQKWVPKVVSKFHDNPTVDESEIVVLRRQVLGLCGKRESYDTNDISLTSDNISQIPTMRMFENEF